MFELAALSSAMECRRTGICEMRITFILPTVNVSGGIGVIVIYVTTTTSSHRSKK